MFSGSIVLACNSTVCIVIVTAGAVVTILGSTPHHSYYCHGFTLLWVFSRWSTVINMYPLILA
jgi:hypothetical protein